MIRKSITLIAAAAVLFCARAVAFDDQNLEQLDSIVRRVADHIVDTTKPSDRAWNWGENVAMRGLLYASETTGEQRYFDFVRAWLDIYTIGSGRYLALNVDDIAPAFTALLVYEKTGTEKYYNGTKRARNYILKSGPRMPDGALIHNNNNQLWLDTLYMAAPFMAHLGKIENNPALIDDAANQILLNVGRTEDESTYLSYHMWDPQKGTSPEFWARGNAWVVMATVEVLEVMPEEHPKRRALLELLQRRCAAVAELQDKSGLWHTILDRPDSYLEVSATAMFSFAMQRAVKRGWVAGYLLDNAIAALQGIEPYIQPDGRVLGVSAGTGPGDFEKYQKVPTGEYPWGTGAVLLAFSERIAWTKSFMRKPFGK